MAETKKLDESEIANLVNAEFDDALGSDGGDISNERAKLFDYYLQKPFGDEKEGESQVVTSEVSDAVDGIMPSLLRIFTTADNLVSFDPVGPEDIPLARQESDYVNHVFAKQDNAFELQYSWMFDALAQKLGIVKAWWEEDEEITTEQYEGLSVDGLIPLLEDEELEPVEQEEVIGETVNELGEIVEDTLYNIKFRRVKKNGRVRVENVPPEEYRISSDARSLNPASAKMVGHEREVTRDELLSMGFKKKLIDSLSEDELTSPERRAREDKDDERKASKAKNQTKDKSQDILVLREAFMKIDADGDGRSELKQVFLINGKFAEMSDADRVPFHVICPHPLPHKHFGRATAEKVSDIQEVNTELLRQTLNNLYRTNNPGHGVWDKALSESTMSDLLTTRVGAVTKFSRPPGEAYAPMTVPFTAGASFPMIEYFEKLKKDRTGIGSDSEGLSPDALKNIQQSVLMQSTDMSKMKVEAIARIFAETGYKTLFLHIHELLLKHQTNVERVELRGQWVDVNPSEWKHRRNMTVNIGLGIGTREQNLLHLNAIWEKQREMVQAGGMNLTVTPKNIYNTASEIVKNANLKMPGAFFTDPGEQPAPPPGGENNELQQAQIQLEQRRQQLDAQRNQIGAAKLELKRQEDAAQHQREMLRIEQQSEAREDKFYIENEKLKNTIFELKGQMEEALAKSEKIEAETQKIIAETQRINQGGGQTL